MARMFTGVPLRFTPAYVLSPALRVHIVADCGQAKARPYINLVVIYVSKVNKLMVVRNVGAEFILPVSVANGQNKFCPYM